MLCHPFSLERRCFLFATAATWTLLVCIVAFFMAMREVFSRSGISRSPGMLLHRMYTFWEANCCTALVRHFCPQRKWLIPQRGCHIPRAACGTSHLLLRAEVAHRRQPDGPPGRPGRALSPVPSTFGISCWRIGIMFEKPVAARRENRALSRMRSGRPCIIPVPQHEIPGALGSGDNARPRRMRRTSRDPRRWTNPWTARET